MCHNFYLFIILPYRCNFYKLSKEYNALFYKDIKFKTAINISSAIIFKKFIILELNGLKIIKFNVKIICIAIKNDNYNFSTSINTIIILNENFLIKVIMW